MNFNKLRTDVLHDSIRSYADPLPNKTGEIYLKTTSKTSRNEPKGIG